MSPKEKLLGTPEPTFNKVVVDKDMLYNELSYAIYSDKEKVASGTQPFDAVFDREVVRVMNAVNVQQYELEASGKALLIHADAVVEGGKNLKNASQEIQALQRKMEVLTSSCLNLQKATTDTKHVLRAVAEKADAALEISCCSLLEERMPRTILNSAIVCISSDIYAAIRKAKKNRASSHSDQNDSELWQAPSSFSRATTKYWIKDDNLTSLLLGCVAEAPLLVYGKKGALTSPEERRSHVSEGDKLWKKFATPITSVYFDSGDMTLYKARIARLEGAQLLRARWYGNNMPTADGIIFLELKTHHEQWVKNQSVKERVSVQERDMPAFLNPVPWTTKDAQAMVLRASPDFKGEEMAKAASLLFRMHRVVVKHKLQACVRSVYLRAAFQSPKSNGKYFMMTKQAACVGASSTDTSRKTALSLSDLRLTLDRNVTLVNEAHREPGRWCLVDAGALQRAAQSAQAPFNVFEVKLAGEDPMPQGFAKLKVEGVMEEATKFSKFLTGAAAFNRVPTLPYWAKHEAFADLFGLKGVQASMTPEPQNNEIPDPCDMCYHLMPSTHFGNESSNTSVSSSSTSSNKMIRNRLFGSSNNKDAIGEERVKIATKKPVKVEPKSYFANERTFIQWISAGLLLLTVSTIMMGNGYYGTAALVSFAAFSLVVYATFVYFRRIKLLASGKAYGYVDHVGPSVLAVGVSMGVFVVFVDVVRAGGLFSERFSWEEDDRRLSTVGPAQLLFGNRQDVGNRRLETVPSFYEEEGECFQQSTVGINPLKYQPGDLLVDQKHDALLVASAQDLFAHPLNEGRASSLLKIPDTDLGALTIVGDRIFALAQSSGHDHQVELIEAGWRLDEDDDYMMEVLGRWEISDTLVKPESMTFVPDADAHPNDERNGQLYVGIRDMIHAYELPPKSSTSRVNKLSHLTRVDQINTRVVNQGFGEGEVISAMHNFEGVTYFLHSKRNVLHAWDLGTGAFLAEIPLPTTATNNQWKGIAFERRLLDNEEGFLRGRNVASLASSELFLHLTADAPPQIWSFKMDEGFSSAVMFPDCAGASTSFA